MIRLNPLEHPICFAQPERIAASAWIGHIPFAMYLTDVLRPRVIVELGTFTGVSYCAFCQAVQEIQSDARCYGIDGCFAAARDCRAGNIHWRFILRVLPGGAGNSV